MARTREAALETGMRGLGSPQDSSGNHTRRLLQIEDHPKGYPRFSALIASHDSFHICRRFSYLRARLLLLKQDKLSMLEEKLKKIDYDECNSLRLGSQRRDDNADRLSVMSEIDEAMHDYDDLIERNNRILGLEDARPRNVSNLRNWVNGNGCVARAETAYLAQRGELVSVAGTDDTIISWLEALVEDGLSRMRPRALPDLSQDPNVYVPIKSTISQLTRALMTPLIIVLLLVPVIVCNYLTLVAARVCTIVVATTIFVGVLSASTRAKAVELVVAGATYTTVLTVFISTTSNMP